MIIGRRSLHIPGVVIGSARTGLAALSAAETPEAIPRPTFREVFEAHVRYVWRSLLGLGVGEADVPDASQQVFLVVHARLAADQIAAGSMRTFVYGVCLRVASDFRRRAHRHHERLYAEPPESSFPAGQEDALAQREALGLMEEALARLPAAQRDTFVLYEIEELGMAEVAAALDCPLQTAYSRLHAARKAVMAALDAPPASRSMDASGRNR